MTKKILSGILAGVSVLSLSAAASAATTNVKESTISGTNYDVEAGIVFGTVDAVLPATLGTGVNGVRINPYGAAVTTILEVKPAAAMLAEDADAGTEKVSLANNSFIASPYYSVKNNDTQNGLKVHATVSVKKASGLVIVDQSTEAPANFYTAVEDAAATNPAAVHPAGSYNPLVSYDKITAVKGTSYYTGGKVSAKQAMNTAVSIIGSSDAAALKTLNPASASTPSETSVVAAELTYTNQKNPVEGGTYRIDFLPKGNAGGTLLWLPIAKRDDTDPENPVLTPSEGWFTVKGDLNPEIDRENYTWNKEALSLNIVLKLVPTYDPHGVPGIGTTTPDPDTVPDSAEAAVYNLSVTPSTAKFDRKFDPADHNPYTITGVSAGQRVTFNITLGKGFEIEYYTVNSVESTNTYNYIDCVQGDNTMEITIKESTENYQGYDTAEYKFVIEVD